ncbi:hypothetical protein GCM10023340_39190 [Nocardioides marinquilinus]|uniref:DUF222 domain-containing protein n=1 Tax=Nocardioides marinquilinus TaxID=1210400 RepID=A0ABP9Q3V6_9ACTN
MLDRQVWPLDAAASRALLVEVSALSCQIAELELRLLDHACRLRAGEEAGASSTATWLAHATRQTARSTHAKARLAVAVVAHDTVRRAMGRGELLPDQARAVLDAALRPGGGRQRGAVEQLVAEASSHCAPVLRMLARTPASDDPVPTVTRLDDASADPEPGAGGAAAPEAPEAPEAPGFAEALATLETSEPAPHPGQAQSQAEAHHPTPSLLLENAPGPCRLSWTVDASGTARGQFVVPRRTATLLATALGRLGASDAGPTERAASYGRAFCAFVEARAQVVAPPAAPHRSETAPGPVRGLRRRVPRWDVVRRRHRMRRIRRVADRWRLDDVARASSAARAVPA